MVYKFCVPLVYNYDILKQQNDPLGQFIKNMYMKTIIFLKNFMKIVSKVKIESKGCEPCQSEINLSTQSILDLQSLLLKVKGCDVKYFLHTHNI